MYVLYISTTLSALLHERTSLSQTLPILGAAGRFLIILYFFSPRDLLLLYVANASIRTRLYFACLSLLVAELLYNEFELVQKIASSIIYQNLELYIWIIMPLKLWIPLSLQQTSMYNTFQHHCHTTITTTNCKAGLLKKL